MDSSSAEKHSPAAVFALFGVTLIWGTTFIVNAEVIGREPPIAYLALRFCLAAVVLFAASARKPSSPGIWRDSIGMGLLLTFGMASQIAGQTETSASKTAFITGLSVVLTPLVGLFRTRRFPGIASLTGVLLATGGFFFISWPSGGGSINRGDLMVLACAIFFAIYIVEAAERNSRHDVLLFTARQMLVVAATLVVISVYFRLAHPPFAMTHFEARPLVFDRGFTIAVAYMTIFATLLTFTVQTWSQARLSATRAAIIFALEPVWTAIFAAVILGERLGAKGLVGGALVIAGIIVSKI